jgi:4-amino-4-deoxy-L-arabinose transferase-like glycosyltransferase
VNSASPNPPLYYGIEAIPYVAARGDVLSRLYAMRAFSGLLLLVTVVATWLLAGELFARNRLLQFAAAVVAGLQPMAAFMSASVNPDGLLLALFALGFWLGAKILNDGLTMRTGLALSAVAAGAVLTKATGYVLLAAAGGVILFGLWRRRGWGVQTLLRVAAVCAVVVAIPVGAWLVAARASDRPAVNQVGAATGQTVSITNFSPSYFASYLWQFYLPRAGFMHDVPGVSPDYAYNIWVRDLWGVFGWKEVRLSESVYSWLRWISVFVFAAAAVALIRRRVRLSAPVAIFFGLTALVLVLAHHWVEFRFIVQDGKLFMQGRYFLPLLPLAACAGAAALTLVPNRARPAVVGVCVAGLFGLQVLALAAVLERYYA